MFTPSAYHKDPNRGPLTLEHDREYNFCLHAMYNFLININKCGRGVGLHNYLLQAAYGPYKDSGIDRV